MDIVVRAAVVYVFVYLVLRALGKRELGEISPFELVLLFIIGDLVQQSITQNDVSITAAILAISTITLLILVQSYVAFRWKKARPIVEGRPAVVLYHGRLLDQVMKRERMTDDEVRESARKQGIADLHDVRVAVLEIDGKLSFITNGQGTPQPPDDEHIA
jgi:uncharacterized membrane protein YcaP (DUF421 family)